MTCCCLYFLNFLKHLEFVELLDTLGFNPSFNSTWRRNLWFLWFARFETPQGHSPAPTLPPPSPGSSNPPLTVEEQDVRRVLLAANPRKDAGPDRVPGKVLKACAHQLSHIFCRIFNLSLAHAVIPTCLKSATIIPIPKTLNPQPATMTTVLLPSHLY